MSDTLGRITIPTPSASGLTFPLVSDYGFGMTREWEIITHHFGSAATLQSQRFSTGSGLRRFHFIRSALSFVNRDALLAFYTSTQGSFQSFTYNAPNTDRTTTTAYTVVFDITPLSIDHLAAMCRTGITFLEIVDPASAPSYSPASILTRFPSSSLATALLSETQTVIPLFKIQVRDTAVPPLYLSDRRVTVGSRHYLPRVLSIGEAGSDVIMSQDLSGRADNIQFTLGNADRAMSLFVKDTGLKFAEVSFSLFHVGTLIQIDLWKGIITDWHLDGSAQFHISCSDALYPITQNYPRRVISRQCWKKFNDGVNCRFSTLGASGSALAALGGSPSNCDFFFNSTNGCLAHGMSPSFGGHPALPQSVVIKDNGTGIIGGIGRSTVTSTSIVADNIWGSPLPEIWCNDDGDPGKAFVANAIVVAVRDESSFEDVLGIVGAGPLGAYEGMSVQTNADGYKFIVAPFADGFPPQGFSVDSNLQVTGYHPELGLREILGVDPADDRYDYFSLGQGTPQHWDVPDATFANIKTGKLHNVLPFSAGTAMVEVRYSKSAAGGLTPTTTESHSLTVPIARGLTGLSAADGSTTPGLTNPAWVAVNVYLRALGLDKDAPVTQRLYYSPESLYVGDGSGAAEICDIVVPSLIGSGTETQFRFQGTLAEFKPVRDWLTEILSCCLGYYTFEFGRLRVGIRENAAAASAFTLANILYQSLELNPIEAAFEYLKVDFANRDLQYQQDMGEYQDKDHAEYFGRSGAPLTARMRSVGLSTLSQTLRVAATRVREEIGGILRTDQPNHYVEWDNALTASWKTTILALETYVGQVVSITHPDVPTYPGPVGGSAIPDTWKYRIQRWTLHKDWSISITGRSVTDSMYELDHGPPAFDIRPSPLPILHQPTSSLPAWAPDALGPTTPALDALFPNERTFSLAQSYDPLTDGSVMAHAVISGRLPVTLPYQDIGAPDLTLGSITQSPTGGSIPGGISLRFQLCVANGLGGFSSPSKILIIHIPVGTNTNSITISGILWPVSASTLVATAFYSTEDQLVCGQQSFTLTDSGGGILAPTSITVTTAPLRSTYAVPNPATRKIRIRNRTLVHGGVVGSLVTAVDSTTITAHDIIFTDEGFGGAGFGSGTFGGGGSGSSSPDDWTGRVLAVIGRDSTAAPWESFLISSYDPTLGVFTLDHDPVAAGVLVGDAFVVCFLGYDNSADPYTITDAGLANSTNPIPFAGETPNDPNRIGNAVFVIRGKSRGLSAKITANTATSYTLDQPLPIDSTSVYVVVNGSWQDFADSSIVDNADNSAFTSILLNMDNLRGTSVLIGAFTVDINDVESSEEFSPVRMLYMFGREGAGAGDGIIAFVHA